MLTVWLLIRHTGHSIVRHVHPGSLFIGHSPRHPFHGRVRYPSVHITCNKVGRFQFHQPFTHHVPDTSFPSCSHQPSCFLLEDSPLHLHSAKPTLIVC